MTRSTVAFVLSVAVGGWVGASESRKPLDRFDALRLEHKAIEEALETERAAEPSSQTRIASLESELLALDAALSEARTQMQGAPSITGPREPQDPAGLGTLPVVGDSSAVSSGTAFNPSLAVIPDGVFYRDAPSGGAGGILASADGFAVHSHEEQTEHSHGTAPEPGFALRETELAFTGAVDPYFDVAALLAVGEDGVEVEEVYGQTRRFVPGLSLRFGKFLSGFGYQNRQHPHQWTFVDAALPYSMLTGGGINDTGLRLTWLPKLPFYAQIGVEALQGTSEALSAQLGEEASPSFSEKAGPRLFTGFLRVSPNLGFDHAVQLGVSFAHSIRHQELVDDGPQHQPFEGTTNLLGLELVWKYDSPKPYGKGDLSVQSEYLRLVRDLDPADTAAPASSRVSTQDGLYVQLVYGVASRIAAGLRFDAAGLTNLVDEGGEKTSFDATSRLSANLSFDPSEFSRLRVQYSRGSVPVDGERKSYDELYVQFQLSLGAHGAHSF